MNIVMNILWIVLGGLLICIEYIIASLLLMVTIIGIPFGLQTLKLSVLALCPFGMQVRSCPGGEGCLSVFDEYTLDIGRRYLDKFVSFSFWFVIMHHYYRYSIWFATFQVGWPGTYSFRERDSLSRAVIEKECVKT